VPGYDFEQWAAHYRQSLPKLGDFLAARQQRDPHDVFFTTYWRQRLTGSA
jgi:D-arabinono-1,4-lactone oxidase